MIVFLFSVAALNAQTTAFTYQGRLTDAANPNGSGGGSYDFQFSLFDVGNSQIGAIVSKPNVTVTNGIFTVELDFGANAFLAGVERFLQIAVKRTADQNFVTLAPRQQLTSAPFAVQTLNAANLGGMPASQFVQTTDSRLTDARNPLPNSPNYIQNGSAGQTADFKITGTGIIFGSLQATFVTALNEFRLNGTRILDADGGNNLYVGSNTTANTGNNNSFVGINAGKNNTSGASNAFLGTNSGFVNKSGSSNSFFGFRSGEGNELGNDNSFFGALSGQTNSGSGNSFLGKESGSKNEGGSFNSFLGYQAGFNNFSGSGNSFVGESAGANTTSGDNNSFFGKSTGAANITGDNNTLIGANANFGSNNLTFATAIGAGAVVSHSDTLVLGRNTDDVRIPGNLKLLALASGGSTNLCRNIDSFVSTCSSSLRYKTNVSPFNFGLSLVKRLQPITFDWKTGGARDIGFAAEDVAQIEPLLATYNERGEVEGVKYDRISAALVNAVKEQQTQIELQNRQIERQQAQIDALKKLVCEQNPNAGLCKEE